MENLKLPLINNDRKTYHDFYSVCIKAIKDNKEREKIMPKSYAEKKLIELVEESLNINNVSLSDTIFSLGGDSLSAITLSSKICATFGVEIDIRKLLSDTSFKELSDFIDNQYFIRI